MSCPGRSPVPCGRPQPFPVPPVTTKPLRMFVDRFPSELTSSCPGCFSRPGVPVSACKGACTGSWAPSRFPAGPADVSSGSFSFFRGSDRGTSWQLRPCSRVIVAGDHDPPRHPVSVQISGPHVIWGRTFSHSRLCLQIRKRRLPRNGTGPDRPRRRLALLGAAAYAGACVLGKLPCSAVCDLGVPPEKSLPNPRPQRFPPVFNWTFQKTIPVGVQG